MTAEPKPIDDAPTPYAPVHPVRIVTAASLFDGHDAAINLMRRILQSSGAEVIHLGHDRSVREIVDAAIQEDAQAIAVSSYQGGHIEFFKYMVELLADSGAAHIKVFGGGGGTIVPREIAELEACGVVKLFSPEDGRRMGLQGMIDAILREADYLTTEATEPPTASALRARDPGAVARAISMIELGEALPDQPERAQPAPVIGLTGTGGAGKSSVTDELLTRLLSDFDDLTVAVLAVDPSRRRSGGALLGDRIRFNALGNPRTYMRSLATRRRGSDLSAAVPGALEVLQAAGYDLIILETSGIGQGNTDVVDVADVSVYVMTPEYGASSQLEKIDMLDFADLVAINKFEKPGALDALRAVRKQVRRNRFETLGQQPDEGLDVYGTIASRFADPGVTALYRGLLDHLARRGWQPPRESRYPRPDSKVTPVGTTVIPPGRSRYLSEISETCRDYRTRTEAVAQAASRLGAIELLLSTWAPSDDDGEREPQPGREQAREVVDTLEAERERYRSTLDRASRDLLDGYDDLLAEYAGDEIRYTIRGRERRDPLRFETLSGTRVPRVALPRLTDWGDRLRWLRLENVPGRFPYTAGVFPFKRRGEEPKRMFAGEGTPERTNKRFHYLCADEPVNRLSVAFDSVTLYGRDPDERPDIYGKVGESGVSICTLADMHKLFAGFDLLDPKTSVSMTINGPAPILLAMFMNVAIDQQVDAFEARERRAPRADERAEIAAHCLRTVRGTVQADILKEDQAQNTCIFNTEFALRMMGDIQEFFVEREVRNYYSVSVSGYHIAEAGANPITQLAFTLANGFTYVEYYLARGMAVDDFAPNLSFFFSNGLDAEYAVLGRVARRIWSVAMHERYGGNQRSQKLKYHIQTSGRSLHAQEIAFNDIRTTLQALLALYDNCNSLHTNAYDEAVTTPTEESVRRAMAIQLIINRELGLSLNENPNQGAFVIDELTDLVEEAVLSEFDRLSQRGGVLGAMEREYQRSKIQEESLLYESRKHSGELPIIGVNTFLAPRSDASVEAQLDSLALTRATPEEKQAQLAHLREFKSPRADRALEALKHVALSDGNVFAELMSTVRAASLGQITQALFEVGGQYRRNM